MSFDYFGILLNVVFICYNLSSMFHLVQSAYTLVNKIHTVKLAKNESALALEC